MSALYIHIPFCKRVCNYCDFYKKCTPDQEQMEAYVEAVEKEMEYRRDFLGGDPVTTIFFGGGTPSVYHPAVLQRLIDKARTIWDMNGLQEITAEVNPDDATEEYLEALAATDVNRISFGVQSFLDRDLELMNRRHNAQQAVDAIRLARTKGFKNISLDLMYGIPGQSMKQWDKNIMKALSLGVEHISAYHLTVEPGTKLFSMVADGEIVPVDEETSEAQYLMVHKLMDAAGFDHYEISNYAKTPDYRAKHNCNYWCGEKYLGLGPSAHSYDGKKREYAVSSVAEYIKEVGTDEIYGREKLSRTDKYNEFVMVSLRTCCGVRRDVMTERFGVEALLYFEYAADKFVQRGLLVREGNEYKIPPEKFMISDAVIRDLFYESEE